MLNAGVPGFQVFDDLVRLESELDSYNPAIILLYQGHNDLFNTLSAPAPDQALSRFEPRPHEIPTVYPWQLWLERHSLLYYKLAQRLQAIRFRASGERARARTPADGFEDRLGPGLERFSRHVRAFLAVAQSLGIEVVIPQVVYAAEAGGGGLADSVIDARWDRAVPFAPPEVVWRAYARYDSVARVAASSFGALYVPASDPVLWSLDGYAAGDPIHFNDRGARRFAQHLARAMLAVPDLGRRVPTP